jgi:hypothetical protein
MSMAIIAVTISNRDLGESVAATSAAAFRSPPLPMPARN